MRTAAPQMRQVIDAARSRGGFVIVDEIYHGLEYEAEPYTALQFNDDIFVLNSFSKYFGMTGWRLGWMVAPEAYLRPLEKLAQNAFICVSAPAQFAALAAFQTDTLQLLEQSRDEFQRRRDFLLPALREMGFSVPLTPDGAFYIYAGCEAFSNNSQSFGLKLLEQAGVALTPGFDFGVHAAAAHLRFAYTCDMTALEEGADRLARYLRAAV
jgi:aspartate/methionine/tyrosine aminotransferase